MIPNHFLINAEVNRTRKRIFLNKVISKNDRLDQGRDNKNQREDNR